MAKFSDGYITITNVIYEIDDFVELDDGTQHIVDYTEEVPFFELNGVKHYLNEFMRIGE